jgi:4'-phosphopantetheinyl transferase EntD
MLQELLNPRIAAVEVRSDDADAFLYPEEQSAIGDAIEVRRREFATGRACAHRALEELGSRSVPVGVGPSGEPLWPSGVVGSITHCNQYRGCAVAYASTFVTIGIDAEPNEPIPEAVRHRIVHPDDRVWQPLRHKPTVCWDRLLFSAKECVYKAWFPLTQRWLGFQDVTIALQRGGTFSAYLKTPGPLIGSNRLDAFSGRWSAHDGILITALALRRGEAD